MHLTSHFSVTKTSECGSNSTMDQNSTMRETTDHLEHGLPLHALVCETATLSSGCNRKHVTVRTDQLWSMVQIIRGAYSMMLIHVANDWSWSSNVCSVLIVNEQRNILHEIRKRMANWIGHILRRNRLLQQVIEGKIKGQIEVTRRRGRRRKKLLDDLKDRRGYCQLKE